MGKRVAIMAAGVLLLLVVVPGRGRAEESNVQNRRAVVRRTEVNYPELARRMKLSGMVVVRAAVGADGHVKGTTVVSGNSILGQAASSAVREWVFAPGGDESVTVDITFSLRQ
jgi:TonB family protein